jgi:hypothetical protein
MSRDPGGHRAALPIPSALQGSIAAAQLKAISPGAITPRGVGGPARRLVPIQIKSSIPAMAPY